MYKPVLFSTLALIGALAFASFNSSAEDPKPAGSTSEYLIIQYNGRHDTYALLPTGKTQFFPELANLAPAERVDDRLLAIHTLINRFAREGYEYVDAPDINRVVMKRKSGL